MKKQRGFTITELLAVVFLLSVIVAGAFGWVWNIVKLVGMSMDPLTGMLIVRAVGIFFVPLGCIVGYL
jgi:prepilin-type N-terminal cleavage/methylation domain-containing protein